MGSSPAAQARSLPTPALRRRVEGDEWVPEGPRIIRHLAAPTTPVQCALGAVLDAGEGAVLSHLSAAALWGLPGFALLPAHVTTVRRSHPVGQPVGTVHRMRALKPHHGTVLEGIPVVRPELLVLQLAGTVSAQRAERLFDRTWSMRLLSGATTRRVLDEVAASGVRGVRVLRDILDERGDEYVPPATGLEGRFAEIVRDACLPEMDRQIDLGDDHWCGRVDFFDRTRRLVVEVDSEKYHSALSDVRADAERARSLERAGFTVVRVSDGQVFHRPWEVVDAMRTARVRAMPLSPR